MKRQRRDEGSVLPLVLVLIVIGSLVVLPVLDYTITVFKANRVVSDRTGQSEAAKAGLRVALSDPKNVFLTCDGGGNLTPSPNPAINGISVQTTCTEMDEVGPLDALGFAVPTGVAAMQLGATIPVDLSGVAASSPAVPPYPATPDWWASPAYVAPTETVPNPAQYSPTAEDGKIWMPDLPRFPSTVRSSTPFNMPGAYGCTVFFPGRYANPVTLTGRVYFTSGVYYFENSVTMAANADVVVGYGLEDFAPASDCADDLQVAANVLSPPTTFDINGGGATFVFGANGRFVVDNAAMTTNARIRFNQRYADADRGGRISIMTVNGDAAAPLIGHVVTNVNSIPESYVLDGTAQQPLAGSGYTPSSSTYTDKARLPVQPSSLTETEFRTSAASPNGGSVLTWDEVTGQNAGGALLGAQDSSGVWTTAPYEVQYKRSTVSTWTNGCPASAQMISPRPLPGTGNVVSCVLSGLTTGWDYNVRVRTRNEVGVSTSWSTITTQPRTSSALAARPGLAPNVVAVDGGVDDVAQVSWDAPASNLPITSYTATAYRVSLVPHPNAAPVAASIGSERISLGVPTVFSGPRTVVGHVRAFDPNGDNLTLTINTSSLPAQISAVANDADDTIAVTLNSLMAAGTYQIPYVVTDPLGLTATGRLQVDVVALSGLTPQVPQAQPVQLLANVGVPIVSRMPVSDRDGMPLAAVPITVDTSALSADWTVTVSGLDVSITTVAPNGVYSIPYTVTDAAGNAVNSTIQVTIARVNTSAGSCTVAADPGVPMTNACEISLPDLTAGTPTSGDVGYRFEVTATNAAGTSDPASSVDPLPLGFDGTGIGLLPPPARQVVPWVPEPIIDIRVGGASPVEVAIAGYVAVPMGRVRVQNLNSHNVRINGGVMAGTFDIADGRATGTAGSVPIGFKNDIVLQRKVRIVSVAKNVTSTAIVEVNEDGAGYAVNSWVVG
jgi:hypothetical protein